MLRSSLFWTVYRPISVVCVVCVHIQKDFHYEYTQCDSSGGRWRVSVPNPNTCIGGAPNPPVRGKGCGSYYLHSVASFSEY